MTKFLMILCGVILLISCGGEEDQKGQTKTEAANTVEATSATGAVNPAEARSKIGVTDPAELMSAAGTTRAAKAASAAEATGTKKINICDRTPDVRSAIVLWATVNKKKLGANKLCDSVDVSGMTRLRLYGNFSLKSGDFSGLSSLETLDLSYNKISVLPEGIFSGLSSLKVLYLEKNYSLEEEEKIRIKAELDALPQPVKVYW